MFWLEWALADVGRADEDVPAALYDLFLAGEGGWRSTYAGLAAVSGRSIPDVAQTLEHLELAHYVHRAACSHLYIASTRDIERVLAQAQRPGGAPMTASAWFKLDGIQRL